MEKKPDKKSVLRTESQYAYAFISRVMRRSRWSRSGVTPVIELRHEAGFWVLERQHSVVRPGVSRSWKKINRPFNIDYLLSCCICIQ